MQAVLDTLHMGLNIKKTPVVVGNCTGFAVNRVFFPYTMAACLLADLGADVYLVDKIIKGQFGMPMGPFRLTDLVSPQPLSIRAYGAPHTLYGTCNRRLVLCRACGSCRMTWRAAAAPLLQLCGACACRFRD